MLAAFEKGAASVLNSFPRKNEDWTYFIDQIFQKIMSMGKILVTSFSWGFLRKIQSEGSEDLPSRIDRII